MGNRGMQLIFLKNLLTKFYCEEIIAKKKKINNIVDLCLLEKWKNINNINWNLIKNKKNSFFEWNRQH